MRLAMVVVVAVALASCGSSTARLSSGTTRGPTRPTVADSVIAIPVPPQGAARSGSPTTWEPATTIATTSTTAATTATAAAPTSVAPAPAAPAARPQPAAAALAEPLTARELAVLRLIAAGRTNQQIADELHLAVNTVRSYSQQLYGKLGVGSRTQAIARARELGLL
jgi:DNA-binding CsgD family transcriptional regulator